VVNAILYVAEHGCKWRGLPKRFGNWHTIYTRMNRWTKAGVLDRMFEELAARAGRAHQDRSRLAGFHEHQGPSRRHRGAKKNGPQAIGKSRGGWNTKVHMVAADARTAVTFSLSPGQAHDAPEGRALLSAWVRPTDRCTSLMDRAYEGNETRQLALDLGFIPSCHP
jgi:transposase